MENSMKVMQVPVDPDLRLWFQEQAGNIKPAFKHFSMLNKSQFLALTRQDIIDFDYLPPKMKRMTPAIMQCIQNSIENEKGDANANVCE